LALSVLQSLTEDGMILFTSHFRDLNSQRLISHGISMSREPKCRCSISFVNLIWILTGTSMTTQLALSVLQSLTEDWMIFFFHFSLQRLYLIRFWVFVRDRWRLICNGISMYREPKCRPLISFVNVIGILACTSMTPQLVLNVLQSLTAFLTFHFRPYLARIGLGLTLCAGRCRCI
jgi:hypothetical protein